MTENGELTESIRLCNKRNLTVKICKMRAEYITKAEKEKIMYKMGNEPWLVFRVMMETGLRVGDAVALKRSNLKKDGEIWYLQTKAEKTGKVGKWRISEQLAERLRSRKGYLFKGRKPGTHLTRQAVWKRIKKACEEAGIDADGKSPHSMRKVFAVDKAHEEGFAAAKEALQHANDAVTRIYVYADKMMHAGSDEPIRWRDVEQLVDYLIARMSEGT